MKYKVWMVGKINPGLSRVTVLEADSPDELQLELDRQEPQNKWLVMVAEPWTREEVSK